MLPNQASNPPTLSLSFSPPLFLVDNIDRKKLQCLFDEYDTNKDGSISVLEVERMLADLGVAPLTEVSKLGSASSDKPKDA